MCYALCVCLMHMQLATLLCIRPKFCIFSVDVPPKNKILGFNNNLGGTVMAAGRFQYPYFVFLHNSRVPKYIFFLLAHPCFSLSLSLSPPLALFFLVSNPNKYSPFFGSIT